MILRNQNGVELPHEVCKILAIRDGEKMGTLYFGDNLHILRDHIANESVDLIYLDPPFNSKQNYNAYLSNQKGQKSEAQISAFEDTWHWGDQAESEYAALLRQPNTDVSDLLSALRRFLHETDMMAYLVMMTTRLLEMHKVLKSTGSLYLHCDPNASHYLKIMLDMVFGAQNFQNEIVWERFNFHADAKRWGHLHDILFLYSKNHQQYLFNTQRKDYKEEYLKSHFQQDDEGRWFTLSDPLANGQGPSRIFSGKELAPPAGTHWRFSQEKIDEMEKDGKLVITSSGRPRVKRYLDEMRGQVIGDVWTDIPIINSQAKERLGYPTQKPQALLERIIEASSNPGDLVLDPFCGCGTAVHAAQKLGREWIGIDITHLAIHLVERRLKDAFPGVQFKIHGEPEDLDAARDLSERDKFEFQFWACSMVGAQPYKGGKKGADGGTDGIIYFQDDNGTKKIIVSVKGGENVGRTQIADLKNTVEREKAQMGVFVTLVDPTEPMRKEAVSAGFYVNPYDESFPKIQILTVSDLFAGKKPQYRDFTMGSGSFKKAKTEKKKGEQPDLFK